MECFSRWENVKRHPLLELRLEKRAEHHMNLWNITTTRKFLAGIQHFLINIRYRTNIFWVNIFLFLAAFYLNDTILTVTKHLPIWCRTKYIDNRVNYNSRRFNNNYLIFKFQILFIILYSYWLIISTIRKFKL